MSDFSPNSEIIPIPEQAGDAVQLLIFNERLYLACEHAVFVLVEGKLQPVRFVGAGDGSLH